jgi:hypothetical protein
MRAKWSAPIRKYWKISEQMMVKYCDLARAFPQQRLVSFKITDAMQIENGRVLTEM